MYKGEVSLFSFSRAKGLREGKARLHPVNNIIAGRGAYMYDHWHAVILVNGRWHHATNVISW